MHLDAADLETHRTALRGHCYRMLGSAADAEDAVQETIVRAWRSLDRFEGRASLRTWLYRIATNVCLDTLSENSRRARPMEEGPAGSVSHPLVARERTHWLEPIADELVIPADGDPFETAALRQSIRLAFVAALQQLPPRQRAALLLTEVLGWSAAEVAECLETSTAAVNSALQRARTTLGSRSELGAAAPLTAAQSELLERYVDAFLRYDVDTLVSLLREDATLSMPPYTLWLRGREDVRNWLLGPGAGCRGSRLVPVSACASPAFAQYRPGETEGTYKAWGLIVLELGDGGISGWNSFLDTEILFPHFGLPLEMWGPDSSQSCRSTPCFSTDEFSACAASIPSTNKREEAVAMAQDNGRKLFVNIAVRDLNRSKEFFSKLGFEFNPKFSDDKAACMIVSDDAYFMLLTEPFFRGFTRREPCDTSKQTEGMFAITCGSREEVDDLVKKAVDAGGSHAMDPMDHDFMYGWSFYDPDGHHWEVFWMDPAHSGV